MTDEIYEEFPALKKARKRREELEAIPLPSELGGCDYDELVKRIRKRDKKEDE